MVFTYFYEVFILLCSFPLSNLLIGLLLQFVSIQNRFFFLLLAMAHWGKLRHMVFYHLIND